MGGFRDIDVNEGMYVGARLWERGTVGGCVCMCTLGTYIDPSKDPSFAHVLIEDLEGLQGAAFGGG